ncbi:MAG TPA: FtsQ-type POTRA domain-containing protein [Candidatus Binatia bacterium]|nr:FtsQ-type POTRA domain-containing protein [Candidatus Binatia bacterium]
MQLIVFSKNNRRRTAHGWKNWLWRLAALVAICSTATALYHWGSEMLVAARAARAFVLESPYFSVREIQVRGSNRIRGGELVAMAGLKHGMTIWNIDPVAIEKKFSKHPWIRNVVVRREFPRRVLIQVEERAPKAILAMGKLYYVDHEGVVFTEVGDGDKVGLPMITGLRPEQLSTRDPALRGRLKEALRLGELMGMDQHKLSEIHFSAPERVVLYTTAYPTALHMGWGDWDDKVGRVKRILSLWKGHEGRLASLDVSFGGQAVARVRNARQQSP